MTDISIQDLKSMMAAVLRRVGLGEWFTIKKHGKAVARLGPAAEPGLHVGPRYDSDEPIESLGRRASRGAYLEVLADDRRGEDR